MTLTTCKTVKQQVDAQGYKGRYFGQDPEKHRRGIQMKQLLLILIMAVSGWATSNHNIDR
jgi:hypothetical protein